MSVPAYEVVAVEVTGPATIRVSHADGTVAEHNLSRLVESGEAFTPLADEAFFKQVFIDHGAVAWPGEIDLAPDTMWDHTRGRCTDCGWTHEETTVIAWPADKHRIVDTADIAGKLIWFRCLIPGDESEESEYTAEIPTGPVSTVGELVERLQHIPPETRLLTSGYEGGLTSLGLSLIEAQQLDRHGDQEWLGEFAEAAEAQRQAALSPTDFELALAQMQPPTLVGEPFFAVHLYRPGR